MKLRTLLIINQTNDLETCRKCDKRRQNSNYHAKNIKFYLYKIYTYPGVLLFKVITKNTCYVNKN